MTLTIANWFIINDLIQTYIQENGLESLGAISKEQLKDLVKLWTEEVISKSETTVNKGEVINAIINHRIWDSVFPDN